MNTLSKQPKLTRKQQAFVNELLQDTKLSATQAAMRTYGTTDKPMSYDTARAVAAENLTKPSIQQYLSDHDFDSQTTIVEMMKQREDKRLAFDAARDVQDRIHGKATQRVETVNTGINLSIDLTGVMLANSDTEQGDAQQ